MYAIIILFGIDFYLNGVWIFLFGSVLLAVLFNQKLIINGTSIILFLFGLTFLGFSVFSGSIMSYGEYIRGFLILFGYNFGFNIVSTYGESYIKKILLVIIVSMGFHTIINLYYNYSRLGLDVFINVRELYDFWSQTVASATGQAANMILLVSLFYFVIVFVNRRICKIFLILFVILILLYNLGVGSRTTYAVFFLAIIISLLLHMFMLLKSKKNINKIIIIGFSLSVFVIFLINFFNFYFLILKFFFYCYNHFV